MTSARFPSNLPINAALPELLAALERQPNVVLQAPPGAGKSTVVPLALLDAPWLQQRKILMLEPRRLAARAIATRMAQLLGDRIGGTIGFRTRLETRVSAQTRIEVITEGILTRMLQQTPDLEAVGAVIFDEFHERNMQADLGLALCLDTQSVLRPDLRLLVMSATLATSAVAKLMSNATIVTSEGRQFAVDIRYTARAASRDLRDLAGAVSTTVQEALKAHDGDVLVFLPGQGEIRRAQALLEAHALPPNTVVLPLYGELDVEAQDRALQPTPPGHRKVVLATNIAETSLTIEGVRIVIDSGWERRMRFDPATAMNRLEAVRISRASADQRAGRAGRLGEGVCYRLWSQSEHAALPAQSPAEIQEVDLAPLALELALWGVRDPQQLRWLDAPPAAAFAQARDLLRELQALDNQGAITDHGRALAQLGLHPRLAHMVLRGGASSLASEIAALLEERDIIRTDAPDADVDLRTRIDALRTPGSIRHARVDEGARQRVLRATQQIRSRAPAGGRKDLAVGALLAHAYPDRIARRREEPGRFLLSNGRGAQIARPQSLSEAQFLAVAALDLQGRDARIRLAAPLDAATLEQELPQHVITRERIEWDSRQRAVLARRERWFGAILLEERRLERPDPAQVLAAMLSGVRELGIAALPWTREAARLRERLRFAHRHDPDGDWFDVSDEALAATLEDWLAPWLDGVSRADHLARLNLEQILYARLPYAAQRRLDTFAPTHLTVPSGSRIPIDYSSDPPVVAVRLQEVFGMQATPTVAEGRVPLVLHLLSPAHRPVQVTQDLVSFWSHGYADVKRELKGRYPRHYWPDDPLNATATARAKPRGQ
jgi:ATP-dependent helicase HrpB